MPTYRVETFKRELTVSNSEEVVAARLSHKGTDGNGRNYALVKCSEGVDEEEDDPTCGFETSNGSCSRIVSEEGERCWQHQD